MTQPGDEYLKLHALGADHGDCVVIEYGAEGRKFGILVDGGTTATAERVRGVLRDRPDVTWELLVVSHVDHDHIGGVLALLGDASVAGQFADVWFNGRHHLDASSEEALSVEEGIALAKLMTDKELPWNQAFHRNAVRLSDEGRPVLKTLKSGASITVLSPGVKQLTSLAKLWDRQVARLEAKRAAEQAAKDEAEQTAAEQGSAELEAMSADADEPLGIAQMAATKTELDRSATNASSIAFIFGFRGRSLLLGGDAHSPVLVAAAGSLPEGVKTSVDVMKLPHHGSAKNVTKALLKAYPARNYVVSTNGALHDHPDDEAIARVVLTNPDAKVYFNYDGVRAQRWFAESKRDGRRFKVIVPTDEERGALVEVLR